MQELLGLVDGTSREAWLAKLPRRSSITTAMQHIINTVPGPGTGVSHGLRRSVSWDTVLRPIHRVLGPRAQDD